MNLENCRLVSRGGKQMNRIKSKVLNTLNNESGMGVVEVILIIVVLVGLALVFKNQITSIANGIYDSIKTQVKAF
jgi:hypothetical protein